MTNKMKVVFAPGALEAMEAIIPAEKMQDVLDEIKAYAESEEFLAQQMEDDQMFDLEELRDTDPDLYDALIQQLEALDHGDQRNLQ